MSNKIMALLLCSLIAVSAFAEQKKKDLRPEFNKKPYMQTCWSQANPWWRPNHSCRFGAGGPDYAWHNYPDNEVSMWKKAAEICKPYGLTGVQFEITLESDGSVSWQKSLKNAADGFVAAGNGFKISLFVSVHKGPEQKAVKQFDRLFEKLWPILKNHPAIYRLNGAPVLTIYTPSTYSPSTWHKMITNVEEKYGKIIILANAWNGQIRYSPDILRDYLRVFDGISAYANWTSDSQRKFHAVATEIMHKEFPQKIFEASVHNTYTVHFHYGGTIPKLMEKYFKSWLNVLESKPDSIVLTNFFDIYENSRMLPSYELDDILLRTAQYYLEKWREDKIFKSKKLEIYVTNFTNVLLGQDALFEVISFPSQIHDKANITLEVCDAKGKLLHSFEPRLIKFDKLNREVFKLHSLKFSNELALFPRLKISAGNRNQTSDLFPPTMLVAGMRPHLLWWARSLKNMLQINKGSKIWNLNSAINGDNIEYPDYGLTVIQSDIISNSSGNYNQGGGTIRIMRNGREIQKKSQWSLDMTHSLSIPDPIGALDWYSLELINNNGCRYLSTPIWVSGNRHGRKVKLPVVSENNQITEININADRIPFFYYPCRFDSGPLLLDYSGYQHNGFLGGEGYGGGHLDRTAYRHEHLGGLKKGKKKNSPEFVKAGDKKGFYRFKGKEYITIQGGTAFPYASTYELSVRPEKTGRLMGMLGSGNNQIEISLDPEGYIMVMRASEIEGEGGKKATDKVSVLLRSKKPVAFGKWNRIAVVYNLKKLFLYVDNELQVEKNIKPIRSHEVLNVIIIGSKCRNVWQPYDYFAGDIKNIRIYGRNLAPDEFLK